MTFNGKKINALFFIIVLLSLVTACNDPGNRPIKTTIEGSFPAFKGKAVSISEFDINSAIPLDTVKINDDGSFKFKIRRPDAGFYLVKVDNRNFITLVLDREKLVKVSSDGNNLKKNYIVEGSPDSELYHDFEMFLEVNRAKVDSLSKTYKDAQRSASFHSIQKGLDSRYEDIFSHQRQYSLQFLENHCSSLASLLVINRRFGEKKIINEEADFRYFLEIDSCLSVTYPSNKHLAEHKRKIQLISEGRKIQDMAEKRLANGNQVPDISLQNPAGKNIQLHSLEGKPVILYFWASWDKDSRKSNEILNELVVKTGKSKLFVYAIGMESYKEVWENAIKADGLQDWIHVTDYLNIHSSAKTLFNIPDRFPYFIVLDSEMAIRYKGSDYNELAYEINRVVQ
jgi:thiol-disulfide isomerase/thioredoxin